MLFKTCSKCGIEKSVEDFVKDNRAKSGRAAKCKKCDTADSKAYYQKKKKERLEYHAKYREENKDKKPEYNKQYYRANKNKIKLQTKEYRQNNRNKTRFYGASYKARKKKATPKWANLEVIESFYYFARFLELATFGKEYHVDHIVPLRGKCVSGLHVEDNLQVLRAEDNLSKHNTFKV